MLELRGEMFVGITVLQAPRQAPTTLFGDTRVRTWAGAGSRSSIGCISKGPTTFMA